VVGCEFTAQEFVARRSVIETKGVEDMLLLLHVQARSFLSRLKTINNKENIEPKHNNR
jgi:hypothetical protein